MLRLLLIAFGTISFIAAFFAPAVGFGIYTSTTWQIRQNVERLSDTSVIPDDPSIAPEIMRGLASGSPAPFLAIALCFAILGVLILVAYRRIVNLEERLANASAKVTIGSNDTDDYTSR